MILAEKIMNERKKNGWSQEEFAAQMNVTRQSVSKWEGALSTPDLEKILQMAKLFGVSTDYLLKDELEAPEYSEAAVETSLARRVSMAEASNFLQIKEKTSVRIALAVALCILSPVCLLILGGMSQYPQYGVTENLAGGIGMVVLLLFAAIAAAIFIHSGMQTKPYEYLETEPIETEYGVSGMVREKKRLYQTTYMRSNIAGTCLCILSVVPLFAAALFSEAANQDLQVILGLALLLVIAAIGASFFVVAGIRWASMDKLLEEGEFTKRSKTSNSAAGSISVIYWLVVVAIYLGYCFITNDWKNSWVIWPMAGVLFAALMTTCRLIIQRKKL